jgi:nucleoside-diphosphate-sugar epimerase
MQVFVTGATGVLGRSVVRLLNERGHQVRGLSRSPKNAALLRELGAEAIDGDLFAPVTLRRAMDGCEAVLHLATKIPSSRKLKSKSAWLENDSIRREGTRNLVDAALLLRVSTFIYPSVCFVYPDRGADWIDSQTTEAEPNAMTVTTLGSLLWPGIGSDWRPIEARPSGIGRRVWRRVRLSFFHLDRGRRSRCCSGISTCSVRRLRRDRR